MYWSGYVSTVLFENTRDTKSFRKLQKYLEGWELGFRCERKAARQSCGIVRRESMKQLVEYSLPWPLQVVGTCADHTALSMIDAPSKAGGAISGSAKKGEACR